MKYVYNYITTNLINGKRYVGMHESKDLNDGYLGSGNLLRRAFKKHGKQNFCRRILCFCDTREEASANERKLIELFGTLCPFGYNISDRGGNSSGVPMGTPPWNKGKVNVYGEETIQKIREARLRQIITPEMYKKAGEKNRGKKRSPDAVKRTADKRRGQKFRKEVCENIRASHNTPEYKEKMRKIAKARPPRKLPEEHKANIRKAMQTPEARQNMSNIKNSRTQEEKYNTFLKGIETRIKHGKPLPGEIERDERGHFKKKAA